MGQIWHFFMLVCFQDLKCTENDLGKKSVIWLTWSLVCSLIWNSCEALSITLHYSMLYWKLRDLAMDNQCRPAVWNNSVNEALFLPCIIPLVWLTSRRVEIWNKLNCISTISFIIRNFILVLYKLVSDSNTRAHLHRTFAKMYFGDVVFIWHPNWVRLAPNGTNLGLFKVSFNTFWLGEPKCTETDLKKSPAKLSSLVKKAGIFLRSLRSPRFL